MISFMNGGRAELAWEAGVPPDTLDKQVAGMGNLGFSA